MVFFRNLFIGFVALGVFASCRNIPEPKNMDLKDVLLLEPEADTKGRNIYDIDVEGVYGYGGILKGEKVKIQGVLHNGEMTGVMLASDKMSANKPVHQVGLSAPEGAIANSCHRQWVIATAIVPREKQRIRIKLDSVELIVRFGAGGCICFEKGEHHVQLPRCEELAMPIRERITPPGIKGKLKLDLEGEDE